VLRGGKPTKAAANNNHLVRLLHKP
jgi:hypothetical protein